MKILVVLILALSFNALAKPKASDFQEVLSEDESATSTEATDEEEPKVKLKENEEILSGTVRVMRKIDRTEVFFKDLKDSYIIQSGSGYSALYSAFEQSQKKGTSVSFKANTKSRNVISLESSNAKSPTSSGAGAADKTKNGAGSQ